MADMHKYETIVVTKPDLTEEAHTAIIDKIKSVIEKNGKLESVEDWGMKKLAYEIDYIREGHYVLINFEAAADFPADGHDERAAGRHGGSAALFRHLRTAFFQTGGQPVSAG